MGDGGVNGQVGCWWAGSICGNGGSGGGGQRAGIVRRLGMAAGGVSGLGTTCPVSGAPLGPGGVALEASGNECMHHRMHEHVRKCTCVAHRMWLDIDIDLMHASFPRLLQAISVVMLADC